MDSDNPIQIQDDRARKERDKAKLNALTEEIMMLKSKVNVKSVS